jgi:hypothetical protein
MYKITVKRVEESLRQIDLVRILIAKRGLSLSEAEQYSWKLMGRAGRTFDMPVAERNVAEEVVDALEKAGFECILSPAESGCAANGRRRVANGNGSCSGSLRQERMKRRCRPEMSTTHSLRSPLRCWNAILRADCRSLQSIIQSRISAFRRWP